ETWDSKNARWVHQTRIRPPSDLEVCDLALSASSQVMGAISPTCPTSTEREIVFSYTNATTPGAVQVTDASSTLVCPTSGIQPCLGISIPFRTSDTPTNPKIYKVYLYGLTGMPRLMDQW